MFFTALQSSIAPTASWGIALAFCVGLACTHPTPRRGGIILGAGVFLGSAALISLLGPQPLGWPTAGILGLLALGVAWLPRRSSWPALGTLAVSAGLAAALLRAAWFDPAQLVLSGPWPSSSSGALGPTLAHASGASIGPALAASAGFWVARRCSAELRLRWLACGVVGLVGLALALGWVQRLQSWLLLHWPG